MERGPKSGELSPKQKESLEPSEDIKEFEEIRIEKTADNEQETAKIERVREKINESRDSKDSDLIEHMRLREIYPTAPVQLSENDKEIISDISSQTQERIARNYQPGFGVFPSAGPKENYYEQVWSRDFAHAVGNYFAQANPQAAKDSLETVFKNQREDGALPYRVERRYAITQAIPKIGPKLSKALFNLIQVKLKHKTEKALYEGESFNGAEDTVPAVTMAAGEFFLDSEKGKEFATEHFDQMKKAIDFFRKKTDPEDGLAIIKNGNPDWTETILRKGKLGFINVCWARSLRLMEFMARRLKRIEDADAYQKEYGKVKKSVLEKIYNKEEGYFRAKEGDDRIDTVASIFGALYFLNPEEAVRVEENLEKRVKHSSGLQNFSPPYSRKEIFWVARLGNHEGYHNEFVWPWVTCENIQVKIKIALQHPDEKVRNKYKQEAVDDLLQMSQLFKQAGGAYEIFRPDEPIPASTKTLGITTYTPPKNLLGSLAAYQGAYGQLKKLGWI